VGVEVSTKKSHGVHVRPGNSKVKSLENRKIDD